MSQSAEAGNQQSAQKVAKTVETLREIFAPLTAHLNPDVEPATVYRLQPPADPLVVEPKPPVDFS